MANYRKVASKLQTALSIKQRIVRINTYQFYSQEQERLINVHSLVEKLPRANRKGEIVMKDIEIFKSCSMPEIVKFLANEYKAGG